MKNNELIPRKGSLQVTLEILVPYKLVDEDKDTTFGELDKSISVQLFEYLQSFPNFYINIANMGQVFDEKQTEKRIKELNEMCQSIN